MSITYWPANIKRTKQREIIWNILKKNAKPMTAAEIAAQAGKENNPLWMSTIYRTLDFFLKKKFITKTTSAIHDMSLYELSSNAHHHYAVCTICHKVIPIENCPIRETPTELSAKDFAITGHNFEIYGICHDCQQDLKTRP